MRHYKRVVNVGRWRVAVMSGGRYRFGLHRRSRTAFSAGLGVCVLNVRRRRAKEGMHDR